MLSFDEYFKQEQITEKVKDNNFYDKFWINEIESIFETKVSIDKHKTTKALYGGETITQVGYKFDLDNNKSVILEGLQINGYFVDPAVILFENHIGMLHGSLKVTYDKSLSFEEHIKGVLKSLKNKINK